MKQVLQDLKSGAVIVADVPEPLPAPGRVLVKVRASLLSAGTEGAQVAKGKESLVTKLREKPQLFRQGLKELREQGWTGVRAKIASKYEGYDELGYSCAGTVVEGGDATQGPTPGQLVACAGANVANHAEFVSVPELLTVSVPDGVSAEAAAYTTMGAVAMQGLRQAKVQLGEYVAVIGLGLVGLLSAQLLRATGCRVLGIDPWASARERGLKNGCDAAVSPQDATEAVLSLSGGFGADAVIICAATSESAPVELAGKIARSRGRVVMVGATGMTIPRLEYYRKELSFSLSRAYGPGRYDRSYEEEGQDYPVDYVRFTLQRNMRAFLELAQKGQVNPAALTTHHFPLQDAPAAYAMLNDRSVERVGIVLEYSSSPAAPTRFSIQVAPAPALEKGTIGVGFVGAGAYAQGMLLPLLKERSDVALLSVMTRQGSHALHAARRFGFKNVCTRAEEILTNPSVQLVFVSTRHDSHAEFTCRALEAGKHVWVEKPLALTLAELKAVAAALRKNPACRLVVGFNRPFSRSARWLSGKLGTLSPRMMFYRVNAGQVPSDSWVHDPAVGGGRLLGEGCHFFDFLSYFAGTSAESVHTETPAHGRSDLQATGNFACTVRFQNASVGQLLYSAQGAPSMGKEYFECFTGQSCGSISDYRSAEFFHREEHDSCSPHRQDKGQASLLEAFIACLRQGGPPPMSPEQILESSILTLAAQHSLLTRTPVAVADFRKELA